MLQEKLRCPECGSTRLWKAGIYYAKHGTYQRWLCRDCGFRFSEASLRNKPGNKPESAKFRESEGIQRIHTHSLKICKRTYNCQICVWKDQTKNLAPLRLSGREKSLSQQQAEQKSQKAELRGKIVEFLWWMKKQGYAEQTIYSRGRRLQRLIKLGANLFDPESVKEVLARQRNWSQAFKETVVISYDLFAKWAGISWERPRYKREESLPWIPTEKEIDQLIAGLSKRYAAYLQLLKETGMRAGEAFNLKWDQIDFETGTVRVTPEKGSKARIFKLSKRLLAMISSLSKNGEKIFGKSNYKDFYDNFRRQRNRIAEKLKNPRIKKICPLILRHFKGTWEYHRTKDILHVKETLGHRNIKNTMIYIQLEQALFKGETEYVCKVARTVKQAKMLIEAGFEFVCEIGGAKLFRKPK